MAPNVSTNGRRKVAHKTDTTLTGAAGEHLVLSRLLQRGIVAAQAPEGVRTIDLLVNPLDGGLPLFLQVKSRQYGSDGGWHMRKKHEEVTDWNIFYCFVDFEPTDPVVFVVPSEVVAVAISEDHKIWLSTPGRRGQAHNDHDMRRVRPTMFSMPTDWMEEYRENWKLLDLALP